MTPAKITCVQILCLSCFVCWGCRDEVPSLAEMSWRRNKEITHEWVSEIEVLIDGVSIDSGSLVIPQGQQIAISGTLKNNPASVKSPNHIVGNLSVAHRPAGTSEESWAASDLDREWVGPRGETFEFPAKVELSPGEYELRVYVTNIPLEDNLPRVEYVARGQMTVIPATDAPAKVKQKKKP